MSSGSSHLRAITRIFWVFLTLGCGIFPSLLFFAWIERNMAVPGILYQKLHWPWLAFWDASLGFKLLWDFALFCAFGFFHTFLAQSSAQSAIRKVLPVQCIRPFYVSFTGLSALVLMGTWQNTGVIVWLLPGLPFSALSILSLVIYWGCLCMVIRLMRFFDPFEFLGLRQIYSRPEQIERMSSGEKLLTHGMYSKVRHPIYFFTLLAFLAAPMMSLDRLLLAFASLAYLYFAIPIEERKLEAKFGAAYGEYRKTVPAIFPRFL